MEDNKLIRDYLKNGRIDVDKLIDDYFNYIYVIVANAVNIAMTKEDIEEIISDVFAAIWKKSEDLVPTIKIKPYLVGIAKNIIRNRYRDSKVNLPISDYEDTLIDEFDIQKMTETKEQNEIISNVIENLKTIEYEIFIKFYYEGMSIKEISSDLKISSSNIKVILHRIRKILRKKLEDGGYGYGK